MAIIQHSHLIAELSASSNLDLKMKKYYKNRNVAFLVTKYKNYCRTTIVCFDAERLSIVCFGAEGLR